MLSGTDGGLQMVRATLPLSSQDAASSYAKERSLSEIHAVSGKPGAAASTAFELCLEATKLKLPWLRNLRQHENKADLHWHSN